MSTKPETTFIARVHRHLPPTVYRMKNHNPYVGGVADMWYDGPKGDLWVEYKWLVPPKRDDTMVSLVEGKNPMLSHLQQQWLEDRWKSGRQVCVTIGTPDGVIFMRSPGTWTVSWSAGDLREEAKDWPVKRWADYIKDVVGG